MDAKSVAVVGGGACGHAIAAYLAKKDYDVRLIELEEFRHNVEPLLDDPVIKVDGADAEGNARLSLATLDFEEGVNGAKWILVVVPAYGHEAMASALAPHLKDGQIISVNPGPSIGSLAFRHHLDEGGSDADVTLMETHWVTLNGKLKQPGVVSVGMIVPTAWFAALPSRDTEEIADEFMAMFPHARPADTILHTSFESFNIMAHSAPMVLNAGRVEYAEGDYRHYAEGITRSVGRVIDDMDRERLALCSKLGIDSKPHPHVVAEIFPSEETKQSLPETSYRAYQTPRLEHSYGPDSLESRYLTEDIPYGLVSWVSIGDAIGVDMPVSKALVKLASALMGQNYMEQGRTLANIGLEHIHDAESLMTLIK